MAAYLTCVEIEEHVSRLVPSSERLCFKPTQAGGQDVDVKETYCDLPDFLQGIRDHLKENVTHPAGGNLAFLCRKTGRHGVVAVDSADRTIVLTFDPAAIIPPDQCGLLIKPF